jgi:hypothetical protein
MNILLSAPQWRSLNSFYSSDVTANRSRTSVKIFDFGLLEEFFDYLFDRVTACQVSTYQLGADHRAISGVASEGHWPSGS